MTTPVVNVIGIGLKTAAYLKTKRITTAEKLITYGAENLAKAPGIGLARAEAAIANAKQLIGKTVTPGKSTTSKKSINKNKGQKKEKKPKKDKGKKKDKKNKKNKKKDKKKNKKDKKKNK